MSKILLGLDVELLNKLDSYASANGHTRTWVIRKALEQFLKAHAPRKVSHLESSIPSTEK